MSEKSEKITHETRRESHHEIQDGLGKRQMDVLDELMVMGQATANELAMRMFQRGYFPAFNRNYVHPRLHELEKAEKVKIVGKKVCGITGKTCAIYSTC